MKGLVLSFVLPSIFALSFAQAQTPSLARSTTSAASYQPSRSAKYLVAQSTGQSGVIGQRTTKRYRLSQGYIQPYLMGSRGVVKEHPLMAAVYPNPFDQRLHIQLEENTAAAMQVRIFDVAGRKLYEEDRPATQSVDIQVDFAAGLYVLMVRSGGRTFTDLIKKN